MASAFETLGVPPTASEKELHEAYHTLAKRWHPDRFAPGPEKMWAEEKMIVINKAYREAVSLCRAHTPIHSNKDIRPLGDVRHLVELGQLAAARQALMRVAQRDAEWNYLFGSVLYGLGERKKAVLYLSVATHQQPDNRQYRDAYLSARIHQAEKRVTGPIAGAFSALFERAFGKKATTLR